MADVIEIALLRVSPDSKYLEFSVNCPLWYEFNMLYVTKYDVTTKAWETVTHDASTLLPVNSNEVIMKIAMSAFTTPGSLNNDNVTMYKVRFGAQPIVEPNPLPDPLPVGWPTVWPTELIEMTGLCSNVNFVYANLLDLIMRFTTCCISEADYDNLDRNHMILYAHTEAMRLGRELEAIFFYNIIWSLFTSCGPTTRQNDMMTKPCNCD